MVVKCNWGDFLRINDTVYLKTDITYNGVDLKSGLQFTVTEVSSNRTIKVFNKLTGEIILDLGDVTHYKRRVVFSKTWGYYITFILIGVVILIITISNLVNYIKYLT